MKNLIKDKKIVIIDIETSGIFCGEDGNRPSRIVRVDATKIENGKVGETYSSLVACKERIPSHIVMLTGISNETLKSAPKIKKVLKELKKFIDGYEVYARYSKFVNKFLSYYAKKNKEDINLAKSDDYDEVSMFINSRTIRDYLKHTTENEPLILAELVVKNFNCT